MQPNKPKTKKSSTVVKHKTLFCQVRTKLQVLKYWTVLDYYDKKCTYSSFIFILRIYLIDNKSKNNFARPVLSKNNAIQHTRQNFQNQV